MKDLRKILKVKVEGGLLETALTHSSYANENPETSPGGDNERLEFLGDAVLQFCSGQLLYRRFPQAGAGELTRLRAAMVSEAALWRVADSLHLGDFLRLGRGEDASGGRHRHSLLADAFEAVVGAIYLSSGIREADKFVTRILGPLLIAADKRPLVDPKTALQEAAQAAGKTISYSVLMVDGPDHRRVYEVEVLVDGVSAGRGKGRSKKEAERAAAARALEAGQEETR